MADGPQQPGVALPRNQVEFAHTVREVADLLKELLPVAVAVDGLVGYVPFSIAAQFDAFRTV
ncbi:MAG: hypothetical protein ACRD7E_29600 [Bryobacteraceae bacterium]